MLTWNQSVILCVAMRWSYAADGVLRAQYGHLDSVRERSALVVVDQQGRDSRQHRPRTAALRNSGSAGAAPLTALMQHGSDGGGPVTRCHLVQNSASRLTVVTQQRVFKRVLDCSINDQHLIENYQRGGLQLPQRRQYRLLMNVGALSHATRENGHQCHRR